MYEDSYGTEITCDCNHTECAADVIEYAGMVFCSEGCRDAYIERYALVEDFRDYVLIENWGGFLEYVVKNDEAFKDVAGSILPHDEVMAELFRGFCFSAEEIEEYVEWEEERIRARCLGGVA